MALEKMIVCPCCRAEKGMDFIIFEKDGEFHCPHNTGHKFKFNSDGLIVFL
ncbi:MAG: hypothetical protein N3H30_01420 [Candidatus Micrarchaeota archaeon]|nr:hypothetical protein [Candidatus Micrarchaeota archaeon]